MYLFKLWLSLDICPGVGQLDHLVALFLVFFFFLGNLHYSPQWLYQFTFPPTAQESFLYSTPSPALTVVDFFEDGLEFLFLIKLKAFNFNSLKFHCLNIDVHVFLIVWNILSVQELDTTQRNKKRRRRNNARKEILNQFNISFLALFLLLLFLFLLC